MKFPIVLSFYLLTLSINTFCRRLKIIGGMNADIREFSHHVGIIYNKNDIQICGGSIISEKHILTAAHCVHKQLRSQLRIITGTTNIKRRTGSTYTVKYITIHPYYTGERSGQNFIAYDIAVITINGSITFNQYQNKIKLPTRLYHSGDTAIISGWGSVNHPIIDLPDTLQKTTVNIISNFDCEQSFEFQIRKDQLCTFRQKGIGTCIGDSGGSVVKNGELIGIISFNIPCAYGEPDVHSNVFYFLHFIRSVVRL